MASGLGRPDGAPRGARGRVAAADAVHARGRAASIRVLVELGADVDRRGSFGGPGHGEGVTALHLAAQAGRREAVETLLELGADPVARDALHDSAPAGWARFGGHGELVALLGG